MQSGANNSDEKRKCRKNKRQCHVEAEVNQLEQVTKKIRSKFRNKSSKHS